MISKCIYTPCVFSSAECRPSFLFEYDVMNYQWSFNLQKQVSGGFPLYFQVIILNYRMIDPLHKTSDLSQNDNLFHSMQIKLALTLAQA